MPLDSDEKNAPRMHFSILNINKIKQDIKCFRNIDNNTSGVEVDRDNSDLCFDHYYFLKKVRRLCQFLNICNSLDIHKGHPKRDACMCIPNQCM